MMIMFARPPMTGIDPFNLATGRVEAVQAHATQVIR